MEVVLPRGKPMGIAKFLVHAGIAPGRLMATTYVVGRLVKVNGRLGAYEVKPGDDVAVHPNSLPLDWAGEKVVYLRAV